MKTTPNFGTILGLMVFVVVSIAAPARGQSWVATGSMPPRGGHSAVRLKDGRVLVVGSFVDPGLNEAHLYKPSTGTWTQTGSLSLSRMGGQTATLLNDGRVLVVGGSFCGNDELYDPATQTWTATGSMLSCIRDNHSATLLNDGRVLVAGGFYGGATAELYDPATATSKVTGSMSYARERHTATLLNDGRVLVAGGATPEGTATPTAELYDPATGTWTATGSMSVGRLRHTATLLNDGTVLVAGGGENPNVCADSSCFFTLPTVASVTAEVYDPPTGTWRVTGAMADARIHHTATLLANGKILVAGGALGCGGSSDGRPQLDSAEEYDPVTGTWGARTLMATGGRFAHTATRLAGGVLVAGGIALMFVAADCGFQTTGAAEIYPSAPPPDTEPPDTSITSAVDGKGASVPNGGVTLSNAITVAFTGTDNVEVAGFECRLDGASFAPCASLVTYSGLAVGQHDFAVRAVDTSGNRDGTPALHTWTVDSPPETTITSAVDGRGGNIRNGGTTRSDEITFSFTGTDNGSVAGFECSLDGPAFTACTSPITYRGVSKGQHTFRVRAIDNNGFRDPTPASFTWTRR